MTTVMGFLPSFLGHAPAYGQRLNRQSDSAHQLKRNITAQARQILSQLLHRSPCRETGMAPTLFHRRWLRSIPDSDGDKEDESLDIPHCHPQPARQAQWRETEIVQDSEDERERLAPVVIPPTTLRRKRPVVEDSDDERERLPPVVTPLTTLDCPSKWFDERCQKIIEELYT